MGIIYMGKWLFLTEGLFSAIYGEFYYYDYIQRYR